MLSSNPHLFGSVNISVRGSLTTIRLLVCVAEYCTWVALVTEILLTCIAGTQCSLTLQIISCPNDRRPWILNVTSFLPACIKYRLTKHSFWVKAVCLSDSQYTLLYILTCNKLFLLAIPTKDAAIVYCSAVVFYDIRVHKLGIQNRSVPSFEDEMIRKKLSFCREMTGLARWWRRRRGRRAGESRQRIPRFHSTCLYH